MALKKETGKPANKSDIKPADGWCNVSLIDTAGKPHRVGKSGIALFNDDRVSKSLMNRLRAIQAEAIANGKEPPTTITVNLVATISLATKEDDSDIEFNL